MSRPVLMRLPDSKEARERIRRASEHYHQVLSKSDGFDVCGMAAPIHFGGLREHICSTSYPCPGIVLLYARFGLHRYNFLQGKNLQLSRVKKYNKSTHTIPGSYYITLEAKDPDFDDSILIFQTKLHEKVYNKLLLLCTIARPLGEKETKKSNIAELKICTDPNFFITDLLPKLPTENPFKQFCVLKNSEVQDNNDSIRLYLELAVASTNRSFSKDYDLSNLKILKVAIETNTQDDLIKPISAYDATFYIRYKDSCEGMDVDRIAIVRRILLDDTYIVGWTQSTDTIIPKHEGRRKSKRAQLLFRRLLSVHQPWRLSSSKWRKAINNRRRPPLHKTRFISNKKPSSMV